MFVDRSVEIAEIVVLNGGNFSIENALGSLLWIAPAMPALSAIARVLDMDFDKCAFRAPSVKSHASRCPPLSWQLQLLRDRG